MGHLGPIRSDNPAGIGFITVQIIFVSVATISLAIRLWSRKLHHTRLDASDYLCTLGWAVTIGLVCMLWDCFSHGLGGPGKDIKKSDALIIGQEFTALSVVWNLGTVAIRLSVLLLYLGIFTVPWFKIVCYFDLGINAASFVGVFFSAMFLCRPIALAFNKSIKGGHCGDLVAFEHFLAVWNLLMDVILVCLPMPVLWRLQMKKKKKIGMTLMFGVGALICIVTIARLVVRYKFAAVGFGPASAAGTFLIGIEPPMGVFCACLPFMPSVFSHLRDTVRLDSLPFTNRYASRAANKVTDSHASTALPGGIRPDKYSRMADYEMDPMASRTGNGRYETSTYGSGAQRALSDGGSERGDGNEFGE